MLEASLIGGLRLKKDKITASSNRSVSLHCTLVLCVLVEEQDRDGGRWSLEFAPHVQKRPASTWLRREA